MIRTFDLLGVRVAAVDLERACAVVRSIVHERSKGYVCVAPVSTIVSAKQDPAYRDVLNAAAMVTPDGAPVVWLGRMKGHKQVRRTYGPDLMRRLCDDGRAQGLRHFFYGGTKDVCDKLRAVLERRYPGIQIVGMIAPPFVAEAGPISLVDRDAINAARPDILWVGLGAPKQDFWMSINRPVVDAPVMVGVGAAFDFLAGVKPQAPRWMQNAGLEWLFRLGCEPGRLWRRYLIGNALFVWWVVGDMFRAGSRSVKLSEFDEISSDQGSDGEHGAGKGES